MFQTNRYGDFIITPQDFIYPATWRVLSPSIAPRLIYARGETCILNTDSVAIIGTREPTELGIDTAKRIAAFFASEGYTIISGLATGIDQAAHEGALSVGGHTIAVLPNSLRWNEFYKQRNVALAEQIIENKGLLITEYESGTGNYDRLMGRNRLIVGHALATIPVQMTYDPRKPTKGGTYNAVNRAKAFGRQVWLPQPRAEEANHPAYAGIYNQMMMMGLEQGFTRKEYPMMLSRLSDFSSEVMKKVRALPAQS